METKVKASAPSFADDQRGAVAILFAMSLMALLLTIGVAVDLGRSQSVQAAIQNDLDAALLGAASQSMEPDEVKAAAKRFFNDNWRAKHGVDGEVLIDVSMSAERIVQGNISVDVPTSFMALAGFKNVKVRASSEIELASENLELALVLDVTESMMGAKIDALKSSAKALIDGAYAGPDAKDHVKIAIVPFGDHVNVGDANRNAPWMSVPLNSSEEKEHCYDTQDVIGTSNCRDETFTGDRDGVPFTYTSTVCDYQYGPTYNKCTTYTESQTWYGCAASRAYPLDTKDESWGTPVPGAMNVFCGTPLMTLSDDQEALKTYIDNLSVSGNTYIPAGLFWGWTTLSKEAPFEDAVGYGEKVDGMPVQKVMVLMTDGANTRSAYYAGNNHYAGDKVEANKITSELCTNIKDRGIVIYTVAFDVTDTEIKDILEQCATSPSKFYDADDSEELHTAFANIGSNLTPLRIAR